MNRQLYLAISLVCAIFAFPSVNSSAVYAQSEEDKPLNLDWVKADVDGVACNF